MKGKIRKAIVSALPMANPWTLTTRLPNANRNPNSTQLKAVQPTSKGRNNFTYFGMNKISFPHTFLHIYRGPRPLHIQLVWKPISFRPFIVIVAPYFHSIAPFMLKLIAQLAKATREVNAGDNARGLGPWRVVKHGEIKESVPNFCIRISISLYFFLLRLFTPMTSLTSLLLQERHSLHLELLVAFSIITIFASIRLHRKRKVCKPL